MALAHWPGGPPREWLERAAATIDDLRDPASFTHRLPVAEVLLNRDSAGRTPVDVCLSALTYGTQHWEYLSKAVRIRKQAAMILAKLEPVYYDHRAYEALVHVKDNDADPGVRDAAYSALVRLALARERGA